MRTDRVVFEPYGLSGGKPGGRSQNFIEIGNRREPLPGKVTMTVPHNAVIIHKQAGAGGFGDPTARDTSSWKTCSMARSARRSRNDIAASSWSER